MKRLIRRGGLILVGLAAAMAARADIIYVQGDVSGTWAADTVIVTAEVRVPPGQTLMIQPGVKVLFQVYCKFIVDNNATLLAVGTEQDSILFDELTPGTCWHGIRFLNASDSSRLARCHLTHGWATGAGQDSRGGAVYLYSCNTTIEHSLIDSCAAGRGGGIFCNQSSATIENNAFNGNSGTYSGGAIDCQNCEPVIDGNTLTENHAPSGTGGGIFCENSSAIITNNDLIQNSAYSYGGAICCINVSHATIAENLVSENMAGDKGGGIAYWYSHPTIINNTITGNTVEIQGGGIYCYADSNSIITGNTISGNSADYGGGIYCAVESSQSLSNTMISENNIENNTAGAGGGIYCYFGSPLIDGNTISENIASGLEYYLSLGGGIYGAASNLVARNNLISGNSSYRGGAGIYLVYCDPTISSNIIIANYTTYNYSSGGGIYFEACDALVSDNTICENTSLDQGGGICCDGGNFIIERNIICHNTSDEGGGLTFWTDTFSEVINNTIVANQATLYQQSGAIYNYHSNDTELMNCILWDNGESAIAGHEEYVHPSYCDMQDTLWPGIGNISADPLFVNPDSGDFHLLWGSPCIDTGDPNSPLDPDSTRADMGARYFPQSVNHAPEIISFFPVDLDTAALGAVIEFGITAIDVDGDSLQYSWFLNSFALGTDSMQLIQFDSLGTHEILAFVSDGALEDSVIWIVSVVALGIPKTDEMPTEFASYPCFPNPFNASTVVRLALPQPCRITLELYDLAGHKVLSQERSYGEAGIQQFIIDGTALASGTYLYRCSAHPVSHPRNETFVSFGKVVLIK